MKPLKASEFPELQRAFSGYLHQDFLAEHDTPAAALRAFHDDANNAERGRLRKEARRFLERTAPADFNEVRALMTSLGSRWTPPSRQALVALFVGIASPHDRDT